MRIEPVPALEGHVAVPGDKSISHRAVLVGALCDRIRPLRLMAFGGGGYDLKNLAAAWTGVLRELA